MISRSGSTFLLSLMTVEEKIASFSEPFFDIMQEQFVKGPGNVEDKVNDLMECRFETIFSNLSDTRRGARIQECEGAEARVMKTIRLRLWQMESWIKDSDIKVRRTFVIEKTDSVTIRRSLSQTRVLQPSSRSTENIFNETSDVASNIPVLFIKAEI